MPSGQLAADSWWRRAGCGVGVLFLAAGGPVSGDERRVEERLEFAPQYRATAPRSLAPVGTIDGRTFGLEVQQRFDLFSRQLVLRVAIVNRSDQSIWRPLRLTATTLRPSDARILNADNGASGSAAVWDFGQSVGPDGRLDPGEQSSAREIAIHLPGADEASARSLRVAFLITGIADPTIAPTPLRNPTLEEGTEGISAGIVLVRYVAGVLAAEELSRLNLLYDLSGQEYSPALGGYIAFTTPPTFDGARRAVGVLERERRVDLVTLAPLARLHATPIPAPAESSLPWHTLGAFRGAWLADAARELIPGLGVRVAVLDSGLRADFRGAAESVDCRELYWVPGPAGCTAGDPLDWDGHGTEVAGYIANQPGQGVEVGGAYGATIVSVKIAPSIDPCNPMLSACAAITYWNLAAGLSFVLNPAERIDVVNMSFGIAFPDQVQMTRWRLDAGVGQLTQRAIVVASSGNCDYRLVEWPARLSRVLAVGATDLTGLERWTTGRPRPDDCSPALMNGTFGVNGGSSYGPELTLHGLTAPSIRGTSYSVPQVSAMAAILKARNPNLRGWDLGLALLDRHVLDIHAVGPDEKTGRGRLLASKLSLTASPASATLQPGAFQTLRATLTEELSGVSIPESVPVEHLWHSDAPQVISLVPSTGPVADAIAGAAGVAHITVTAEGLDPATIVITVIPDDDEEEGDEPPAIGSITIAPSPVTIEFCQAVQLEATVRDSRGQIIPAPTGIVWSGSNEAVATANPETGRVIGQAPGTAQVTATVGTASASVAVTVVPEMATPGVADYRLDWELVGSGSADWEDGNFLPWRLTRFSRTITSSWQGSADVDLDSGMGAVPVTSGLWHSLETMTVQNFDPCVATSTFTTEQTSTLIDPLPRVYVSIDRRVDGTPFVRDPFAISPAWVGAYAVSMTTDGADCQGPVGPGFSGTGVQNFVGFFGTPGDLEGDGPGASSFSKQIAVPYFAFDGTQPIMFVWRVTVTKLRSCGG